MLAKLLAPFKNEKTKVEKKVKAPKSPKKEKKKEEAEVRRIYRVYQFWDLTLFFRLPPLLRRLPKRSLLQLTRPPLRPSQSRQRSRRPLRPSRRRELTVVCSVGFDLLITLSSETAEAAPAEATPEVPAAEETKEEKVSTASVTITSS